MGNIDRDKVASDFEAAVNMAPAEIEKWLKTADSKKVGFKAGGTGESVGHASGKRIVKILRKRKAELDDDQYAHLRKLVGYVKRHVAQRPENTVTSRWRYSLMNWGHDPLKEESR